MEGQALAGAKKNARRDGRTIVFIDESGLSERPTRVKTWAPRGQTPVLQYSFNWKQLSLIAGISFWRLYFRFFHGAIKSPQIVEFLKALKSTIRGMSTGIQISPVVGTENSPPGSRFGLFRTDEAGLQLLLEPVGVAADVQGDGVV